MVAFSRLRKLLAIILLLLSIQPIFAKDVVDNTDYYNLAENGTVEEIVQAFKKHPELKSKRFGLYDETFLMLALRYDRDFDVIKTIIKGECSVNDKTNDNRTVFMYAAQYSSSQEILDYLITYGTFFKLGTKGRVQKIDSHGMTAYDYAAKNPNQNMTEVLQKYGEDANETKKDKANKDKQTEGSINDEYGGSARIMLGEGEKRKEKVNPEPESKEEQNPEPKEETKDVPPTPEDTEESFEWDEDDTVYQFPPKTEEDESPADEETESEEETSEPNDRFEEDSEEDDETLPEEESESEQDEISVEEEPEPEQDEPPVEDEPEQDEPPVEDEPEPEQDEPPVEEEPEPEQDEPLVEDKPEPKQDELPVEEESKPKQVEIHVKDEPKQVETTSVEEPEILESKENETPHETETKPEHKGIPVLEDIEKTVTTPTMPEDFTEPDVIEAPVNEEPKENPIEKDPEPKVLPIVKEETTPQTQVVVEPEPEPEPKSDVLPEPEDFEEPDIIDYIEPEPEQKPLPEEKAESNQFDVEPETIEDKTPQIKETEAQPEPIIEKEIKTELPEPEPESDDLPEPEDFEEPDIIDYIEPEPEPEPKSEPEQKILPEEKAEQNQPEEEAKIIDETPQIKEEVQPEPGIEPKQEQKTLPEEKPEPKELKEAKKDEPETTNTPKTESRPYLYDYALNEIADEEDDAESEKMVPIQNPDQADEHGVTLLMKAAKSGNDWDVKNLLLNGADVNKRDQDGWTALMYAVRYQNNLQIVETLIEHGAYVRVRNKYNTTPLLMAAEYSLNPSILALLLENRLSSEDEVFRAFMLTLSSTQGSFHIREAKIKLFIENMAIPINRSWQGKTPLMHACQYATSTDIIKMLLDYGAKPSIRGADGKTAFDYAKENKYLAHDETYWSLNSGN